MQILDNLIIVSLHVLCFIAGMVLSNKYHAKAEQEKKDALERQFLRLRARADADDPCKPYVAPRAQIKPAGDYDGDDLRPISDEFMQRLKENGAASTKFRKCDIAR